MNKYLVGLCTLILVSLSTLALRGQETEVRFDTRKLSRAFQQKLDEIARQSEFPGATAAIILPDGSLITAVAGVSNRETDSRMKPSDRLMSASIGKTYFAAMAIELMLAGKLSLDDKVEKYLGDQDWFHRIPNHADLTIAQLMRHQTGIPRYILNRQVWKDVTGNPDLEWKKGDQLKYIYDAKPVHSAGDSWFYSDTNYIILGLILEKVAGQDAYEYIQQRFLDPNQLKDTIPNDRRELPGLIQGYSSMFRGFGISGRMIEDGKFVFNPQMEWCGGGFCCTSGDLARWAHLYFSESAIQGNYLKLLTKDAADSGRMLGSGSRYGLGVIIRDSELGRWLGHDGGFPGYSSTMGYYPKHKIGAAFMYNTDARGALRRPASDTMTELVQAVVKAIN